MKFALFFGNRGFMPGELITGARADMIKAVTDAGYEYIAMDENLTRYGAIETRDEGRMYHDWLKSHEGEYDGVILCMPIFVDENGAAVVLKNNVPRYLIMAFSQAESEQLADDEDVMAISKRLIAKNRQAYEGLAK